MKVRWVVGDDTRPGGVESVVRTLNTGLRARQRDSAIWSWGEPAPVHDAVDDSVVASWIRQKASAASVHSRLSRAAAKRFRQELTEDPDLVLLFEPGSLPVAQHLTGVARWGIHMHWSPDMTLAPWRYIGGDNVPPAALPLVLGRMRWVGLRNQRVLKSAPFIVSLTESHTAAIRRLNPHVYQVENPAPGLALYDPSKSGNSAPYRIGYVGRLSWEKGPDVLLNAVTILRARGRSYDVVVAGRGPMEKRLQKQIQNNALGGVRLVGWVEEPSTVMRNVDVLVLPSRCEAVPLVLAEGLASGCLVVACDAGSGVRDVLANGALGRIVPSDDPLALALAIEDAMDDVRANRRPDRTLVDAVIRRHDPDVILDRWESLLDGPIMSSGTTRP